MITLNSKSIISGFFLIWMLIQPVWAADSPLDRIERDYADRRITLGQSLLYKLMTIHAPDSLPTGYQTSERIIARSATPILVEVMRNFDGLSASEKEAVDAYRTRPNLQYSYDSPRGGYKIHYNLSGVHQVWPEDTAPANGIPDYVEWAAQYCDSSQVWTYNLLGYLLPPSDGIEGGDSRYDIYLMEIPYYGYTQPESEGPEAWQDYTSFVVIHRNLIGFPPNEDPEGDQKGALKVTAGHEYFHAVQFAYTGWADIWYMEVSSVWFEEIGFPDVNDNYNYLPDFFNYPHWALDNTLLHHEYAAFIWNRFCDQYFDTLLIRLNWEDLRFNNNAYEVIDQNLTGYGTSLSEAFSEFTVWNWCTYVRDDGNHYSDAEDYPLVDLMGEATFYPIEDLTPPDFKKMNGLSASYLYFSNVDQIVGDFIIAFNGADGYEWDANIILAKLGNNYTFTEIPLDGGGDGSLFIPDFDLYSYIALIPVLRSWEGDSVGYVCSADDLPWPEQAVAVFGNGPPDIYSPGPRTSSFWVKNLGADLGFYHLAVSSEQGWQVQLDDTLIAIPLRDSALVWVDVYSTPGHLPGTINRVFLTARSHVNDSVFSTGALEMRVVRRNGDANNDGVLDVSDAVYIVNYVFVGGSEPLPELYAGDANCEGVVDVSDAVYIINHVFPGGPPPPCWPY